MESAMLGGSGSWKNIQIVECEGMNRLFVKGQPYMSWRIEDEVAKRIAIVQLYDLGLGTQEELAESFKVHVNTVSKYVTRFKEEGTKGLKDELRGPKEKWKIVPEVRAKILVVVLQEGIWEYAEIQKRLKQQWNKDIGVSSIRQVLLEDGLIEEHMIGNRAQQEELFKGAEKGQGELQFDFVKGSTGEASQQGTEYLNEAEALGEAPAVDQRVRDSDFEMRKRGREYYSQGERIYLDEMERGVWSAYAGGLLFVPMIEEYHFLEMIKKVIDIPTYEGYSLQQMGLTLFYFDVFEFRSIEDFKTVYPEEYGPIIGRSSSPSIYTLRRFLHRVRDLKKGEELIDEFGKEYLRLGLVQWGVMYIDSHFLPYYGMRVITKGWHGVQGKAFKGSYQFLAVDEKFNPFIFLLRPSSEDLLEKIPELIEKARRLGREIGLAVEDLTVIFDREGYSAELFRKLNEMQPKVKFITWAKYMDQWVGDYKEEQFDKSVMVEYEIQDEEEIKYFETERMMNKYGKMRTLIIENGRKKQRSAIFTNSAAEGEKIIQLICRRWGQETLNKTHKWDHRMDYFPGYVEEELDEQPLVKNPKLKELKR